jgi:hypothetical protein
MTLSSGGLIAKGDFYTSRYGSGDRGDFDVKLANFSNINFNKKNTENFLYSLYRRIKSVD